MAYCLLDILPVELIHYLLNYFSAHEILYTFTNVSSYIDDVLLNYSNYCVNFKSVTRKEFESVCQRIKPDQVVSLTLSDDEYTPGLVELFLSRFQINEFTRLRSLTLVEVGPDFWEPIVTKLIDLKNLHSFIYDSSGRNDFSASKICYDDVLKLDKRLFESYSPVLPQLNRLKSSHGDFLSSVQFPYLRHLIIEQCKANIMKHICYAAPQLKSLETNLLCHRSNPEFTFPFDQLTRLVLRITGSAISMNNMEELMAKLPSLKYLQICGHGNADLVDSQRWQTIISGLNTFNFKLHVSTGIGVQDLNSFRSPFWLIEKHWYVAYSLSGYIFSVPYFADTETDEEFQPPAFSTAPDISIFYSCITQLALSKPVVDINHRFPEVQTLSMSTSIHLSFIEQIVDLNRIQHLALYSITKYIGVIFLINEMPNVYRISIFDNVKSFLEKIRGESFEKIRNLQIGSCNPISDNTDDDDADYNYSIEQLCSVFPCVKHLNITYLCSKTRILSFINQFKQLAAASFQFMPLHFSVANTIEHQIEMQLGLDHHRPVANTVEHHIEMQSALDHHRSAHKLDYTYRLVRPSLHIWL